MNRKVTVVGGAGNVGATVARGVADKQLADVVVIDIADQKAAGVALDMLEACPIYGSDARVMGTGDYADTANSENAIARKHEVLDLMFQHRESIRRIVDLTPQMVAGAEQETLSYRPTAFTINAPHFVFYVQDVVTKMCHKGLFELPDIDCEKAVSTAGLRITTSLDLNLQHTAEQTVEQTVAANEEQYGGHNGALVAIRPATGEILAMVGSVDYNNKAIDGQVNVATSERQPGSSFKPITYATAFKQGWSPGTVNAMAHLPSGDNPHAVPSPRRMAGDPSVLRRYTACPLPPPSLVSSNNTSVPSGERSRMSDQSSHPRLRC